MGGTAADIDLDEILFDKNDARIGRILALFAVASFAYAAVTVWWVPIKRAIGWLLLPMGRRALFAYRAPPFPPAVLGSGALAPGRPRPQNAPLPAPAPGRGRPLLPPLPPPPARLG